MKNFPPTDGSDDSQNEEIIYEEVVGEPFPPKGGRIPPMGGFAPPPFGGYVIEEEIIEEIEEDPTAGGDSENAKQQESSVSESKISAEKANAPKERPAPPRAAPKPKPYKAFKAAVKSRQQNDYDKIHREKKTSKFILPLIALLIIAGFGGGIYYSFKDSVYFASIFAPEGGNAAEKPVKNGALTLHFLSGDIDKIAGAFYSKLSNPITLENLRDIIVTGSINFSDGEPPKNFYCIKRYDSGAFIKVGSGKDEKTYHVAKDNSVYLLEEGRMGGKKTQLDSDKAALLRALTEWDDILFQSAFALDQYDKRGKPKLDYLGERNFDGKKMEAIEASYGGADKTLFYFDKDSGMLKGITFPLGTEEMRISMGDYGDADGVYRFPMSRKIYLGDKRIAELNTSFVSVNRGLFFPM